MANISKFLLNFLYIKRFFVNLNNSLPIPGIRLNLKSACYVNKSIIILENIGEGDCALYCYTNCSHCDLKANRMGEWYYPNSSVVRVNGSHDDIYRDRSKNFIRLNWRRNPVMSTGVYCCGIPIYDMNTFGNFCVGIYTRETG